MSPPALPPSCLYSKITRYITLDRHNERFLRKLEDPREAHPARRRLRRIGESTDELYIVHSGWLYSVRYFAGGKRHVQGFHFAGDVIGIEDVTLDAAPSDLVTATDVTLCPIPKSNLRMIFCEAPRIASILFAFAAIECLILAERLAAVSRLSAECRIAQLLMQIHARLSVTAPLPDNWFQLPVSQEVIGDAVGLTQAYVNRSLRALEDERLIRRRDHGVELVDLDRLAEMGEFEDKYRKIDDCWLPD